VDQSTFEGGFTCEPLDERTTKVTHHEEFNFHPALRPMISRLVLVVQQRMLNPALRRALQAGIPVPGIALLETVGRTSGALRRVPVTNGLEGDRFWIVSEQGRAANYVRNIGENPRVRVKVRGRWREGTARIVDEDPRERLRRLPSTLNAAIVRRVAHEPVVVRIDLDRPH
jgi:deazaflavin-dependent oxidoreductase (nitroreductase family)